MSDEAVEKASPKPRGWRKTFVMTLCLLYGLLAVACLWVLPPAVKILSSVKVEIPAVAVVAQRLMYSFQQAWWIYAAGFAGVGTLGLTGALDKVIKPLVVLALLSSLALAGLSYYVHTLPERLLEPQNVEFLRKMLR